MTDRQLVHVPAAGDEDSDANRVLATEIEIADSTLSRARGLMFRSALPEDYALVMKMGTGLLGKPSLQIVHMAFVRQPLDVVWLVEEEVRQVSRLQPWRSVGAARADRIVELPAGAATEVRPGDRVVLEE